MKANTLLVILMLSSLAACGQFEVSIEQLQTPVPTNTVEIPTNTFAVVASPTVQVNPTSTVVIASPTLAAPTPTQAQQVPPTAAAPTSTTSAEQMIKIVLIEIDGNGQSGPLVGC